MISITQKIETYQKVELSEDEAKEVVKQYIRKIVIGDECYVTKEGDLEHWTSYPHGSGTTTEKGQATLLQKAANTLLGLL